MAKKFQGFKTVRYPVYTVITPQTGDTYSLRTLNVSEVMTMRESLTTGNKMSEILNDILYTAIEHKPDFIKNKTDFLKKVTMKDRDALVYGLYHATYGNDKTYNVVCGECQKTQKIKVSLDKIFYVNNYPGNKSVIDSYRVAKATSPTMDTDQFIEKAINTEGSLITNVVSKKLDEVPNPPDGMPFEIARVDPTYAEYFEILEREKDVPAENTKEPVKVENNSDIIVNVDEVSEITDDEKLSEKDTTNFSPVENKIMRFPLPTSKGIVVYIKEPNLEDEVSINKNLAFASSKQLNLAYDTLTIKMIEEYEEGSNIPVQVIDDRIDLVEAYQLLPVQDRNKIVEIYQKEFGQYEAGLKANWACRSCGANNELNLDILQQFFRAING